MVKRVAVTGSSGLIGGALRRHLTDRGDSVLRVVRRAPAGTGRGAVGSVARRARRRGAQRGRCGRQPRRRRHRRQALERRAQAGGRAQPHRRHRHRGPGPRAGQGADRPDRSASSTRRPSATTATAGDEVLTEQSARRAGLPRRCRHAVGGGDAARRRCGPARRLGPHGPRHVPDGGAFSPLLLLGRLGLGGPMGTGREWWPWITLVDAVAALTHLIDHDEIVGPVNLVGPEPARQKDIARELGTALHRPAFVPAPRFALRVVVGEFADSIIASQRLEPQGPHRERLRLRARRPAERGQVAGALIAAMRQPCCAPHQGEVEQLARRGGLAPPADPRPRRRRPSSPLAHGSPRECSPTETGAARATSSAEALPARALRCAAAR